MLKAAVCLKKTQAICVNDIYMVKRIDTISNDSVFFFLFTFFFVFFRFFFFFVQLNLINEILILNVSVRMSFSINIIHTQYMYKVSMKQNILSSFSGYPNQHFLTTYICERAWKYNLNVKCILDSSCVIFV